MCRLLPVISRCLRADLLLLAASVLCPLMVAADELPTPAIPRTPLIKVSVSRPSPPVPRPSAPVATTRPAPALVRPPGTIRPLDQPGSNPPFRPEPRVLNPTFAPVDPVSLPSIDAQTEDIFRIDAIRPEFRSLPQIQTFEPANTGASSPSAQNSTSSVTTSTTLSTLERLQLKNQQASDLQQVTGRVDQVTGQGNTDASGAETPVLRLSPLPVSRSRLTGKAAPQNEQESSRNRATAPTSNIRDVQQTQAATRPADLPADLAPVSGGAQSSVIDRLAAKNAAAQDLTTVSGVGARGLVSGPQYPTGTSSRDLIVEPAYDLRDPGAQISPVSSGGGSSVQEQLAAKNAAARDLTDVIGRSLRSTDRPQVSADSSRSRVTQPAVNQRQTSSQFSPVSPVLPSSVNDQLSAKNDAATDWSTISGRASRTIDSVSAARQPGVYSSRDYTQSNSQDYARVSRSDPGSGMTTQNAAARNAEIQNTGTVSRSIYEEKNYYGNRATYAADFYGPPRYYDPGDFPPVSPGPGMSTRERLAYKDSLATQREIYTIPGTGTVWDQLRQKHWRATSFIGLLNGVVYDPVDFTPGY